MRRLFLILAFATALNAADLKITVVTRTDSGSIFGVREDTRTEFAHGALRRQEFRSFVGESPNRPGQPAPHMAVINNCDTRESLTLDLDAREYHRGRLPDYPSEQEMRARVAKAKASPPADRPAPNLLVESNAVDTGETAEFFGHTARHFITTVKRTPFADLASQMGPSEETADEWYIDLQVPSSACLPSYMERGTTGALSVLGTLDTHPEFKHTGPVPKGFRVKMKVTTRTARRDKTAVTSFEQEVTELSDAPLDPALFEVPRGFREVEQLHRH